MLNGKILIVTVLLICIFNSSCRKELPSITPQVKSITSSIYSSGFVKSRNQYQVFAMNSGIITSILVKEGDIIKKGTPILLIQNKTALVNSENALINAEFNAFSNNQDKLAQLDKEKEMALRKLKSDSLLLDRQNKLWAQGIGTKMEQEQRELSYQNSKSTLESLKLKYTELKKQLKFLSEQSKKNLKLSKTQLTDYVVSSIADGKVYSVLKEKGEMVNQQTPIAIIGDANEFMMELQVDEFDIINIKQGQKIIVKLESYRNEVFEGIVEDIDPMMNERSRTFTVNASFKKNPGLLYPGLSVEANIIVAEKNNVLTIPYNYLSEGKFVTLKDGKKKEISVGLHDYKLIEVLSGIDSSTAIILTK